MSLGRHTKCGLDADVAKLDLTALHNILQTTYFKAMNELRRECEIPNFANPAKYSESLLEMISHRHAGMTQLLLYIGQVAELAYTVDGSGGRKIEIVNYPLYTSDENG